MVNLITRTDSLFVVPPTASMQPNLLPIRGTVFFDCQANGDSPLTITWQKDGVQLDLTNKAKYMTLPAAGTSHKLLIMGASARDAGKYSCIVTNHLGQATATSTGNTVQKAMLMFIISDNVVLYNTH